MQLAQSLQKSPNYPVERTAGSHRVAAAAHRSLEFVGAGQKPRIGAGPFTSGMDGDAVAFPYRSGSLPGDPLKLLLTSGGVTNVSIRDALVELLGKPISESTALCIPTAAYAHPMVGPGVRAWQFIAGQAENPMVDLGWKSVGVLELTALPSIDRDQWVPLVQEADVLLAAGGDVLYLCHWMRESGLVDLLPSLSETVWVGLSAGSMVMTPVVGDDFIQWRPPSGDATTLGLVDFSICPHLAADGMPGNSMSEAEQWAASIPNAAYAMDDQTAITVVDMEVHFVSEGSWTQLQTLSSESDRT